MWESSPPNLTLPADEVHLWRIALDLPSDDVERGRRLLSHPEREKADRFYFPRDRNRFIVSRAALKRILGRYLRRDPAGLSFQYGSQGKPSLEPDVPDLRFNLSHSGRLALIAVASRREIGVDLEEVRSNLDSEGISKRYFTPRERDRLQSSPSDRRLEDFFALWTGKEACLKGLGRGFSVPLDRFDVSPLLAEARMVLRLSEDPKSIPWSLMKLIPEEGYQGAIAAEGEDWTCRFYSEASQSSP